jgi:protein-L-isoaspartate O-methyltransferase
MVIPVGAAGGDQELLLLVKTAEGKVERKSILAVRFVPLVPSAPRN